MGLKHDQPLVIFKCNTRHTHTHRLPNSYRCCAHRRHRNMFLSSAMLRCKGSYTMIIIIAIIITNNAAHLSCIIITVVYVVFIIISSLCKNWLSARCVISYTRKLCRNAHTFREKNYFTLNHISYQQQYFLCASAELRKATLSFVIYFRLSICSHGTTRLPHDGFCWNLIFE